MWIAKPRKVSKIKRVVVPCTGRDTHGDGARNSAYRERNKENHRPKPPEPEKTNTK